jgi:PAS domain S-box-containing protein
MFLLFAGGAGPIIGAFLGAGSVMLRTPSADFWAVWQAWLLSNTLTGVTLLPLILIVCERAATWRERISAASRARWIEAGALALSLGVVCVLIFAGPHLQGKAPAILYAPLPLLIWAAVRFGPGGIVSSLSVVAGITIAGAIAGRGPFVAQAPADNLIQLQYFLIAMCTPLFLLAALVRQQGQTATSLRRTQAIYRTVVEDQTELICRFLPDGTYTFVNGAYCRYFQRTPEQLIGRTFWEFIPPEAREAARAHLAGITPEHPTAMIEHEVVAPGGEIRWQQWTDHAFFDERGRFVDYQAVGRDITDR